MILNDEIATGGKQKLNLAYREIIKQKVNISVYFNYYQDLRSKLEASTKIKGSIKIKAK